MTERSATKVGVLTPRPVPWVEGGNERHWRAVVAALQAGGYQAELIEIDSPESTLSEVLESYERFVRLSLDDFDVLISGKYPSHMVRHRRHIRHLTHTLRGLYDTYPAHLNTTIEPVLVQGVAARSEDALALLEWSRELVDTEPDHPRNAFPGPFARLLVHTLDRIGRNGLTFEATLSERVAEREGYVDPDRAIAVIPAFTDLAGLRTQDSTSAPSNPTATSNPPASFVTFGRMDHVKRFDLALEAFAAANVSDRAQLLVAGSGPMETHIRQLAEGTPGVRMVGRLSDDDLAAAVRSARAVIVAPIDEDYGLVAAESMAAQTPVITTSDSGGVAEQIEHGITGFIAPPRARAIAPFIAELADDEDLARRMGTSAADAVAQISPDPLLHLVDRVRHGETRSRILFLSTFPAQPVSSGGHRRLRGLAAGLAGHGFDPVVMTLTNTRPPESLTHRRFLADGVEHVAVPRSAAHLRADFQMHSLAEVAVDDIGCVELHLASPDFGSELTDQLQRASAVVLSHPFLVDALPPELELPLVYDAHNVEADLKRTMLNGRLGRDWFLQRVVHAEHDALRCADLVTGCSSDDLDRLAAAHNIEIRSSAVVPNPVDPSLVARRTEHERLVARARFLSDHSMTDDGRPLVLFIGSNHEPNRAALSGLLELAAGRPDLHIVVAGSIALSAADQAHLTAAGRFPGRDHRRLLAMSDVVINPVTSGSGTSLKVIDACAVGVPIVSTPAGARGIDSAAVRVATDLGAGIDAVLADPAATAAQVEAGHALAATRAQEQAVHPLARWLDVVIARRPTPG